MPSRNSPSISQKIREFLLFLLPACLFLSAYPQIPLGATPSMNLEVSLPELWLIFFSVASLLNLPKIWREHKKLFLATATFPLYALLSLLWSANFLRGLLTAGLLILLWYAIWNVVLTLKSAPKIYFEKLKTVFLVTSVVFASVCWFQCFLDLLGVSRETSLLCLGCTSSAFGFPHPNGLTLEPQFMGNLLLAPALFSLELYLKNHKKRHLTLFFFFSATLFLTFSRGAIYAFAAAFIVRLAIEFIFLRKRSQINTRTPKKSQFGYSLLTITVIILSFIFTLATQGVFATLGPTSDNFLTATTKSLHQLSLGKLDFRPEELKSIPIATPDPIEETPESAEASTPAETTQSASPQTSIFSGYVTESTAVRIDLTNKALDLWNDSPENLIFGTGLGSAGTRLYEKFPEFGTPKEIVQNQYASLLLELGLFGYLCLAASLFFVLKNLRPRAAFVLELSYLLTLFFFSGLPNALHIYLFPPLLHSKD